MMKNGNERMIDKRKLMVFTLKRDSEIKLNINA